jgi:IclR family transcriptional regulator, acetate operon repressor
LSSLKPRAAAPEKGQRNEMRMIARAADILRALAAAPDGLTLGQIAKATGLPRSSVQRLAGALEAVGFATTQAGAAGVRLGPELVRLGLSVHANLRALFRPHLQELHARTQDTVDLTLLMDGQPLVVDQITSTAALRVVSFVGRPLPLHATASGKAHLMVLSREAVEALLPRELQRFTRNTLTSGPELIKFAGTSAGAEFAYDREEYEEGVHAIALPIQTLSMDNYAVAVSMPTKRFEERLPLLRDALRQCQRSAQAALGFVDHARP